MPEGAARMPEGGGQAKVALVQPLLVDAIEDQDDGSEESDWLEAGNDMLEDVGCMPHKEQDDKSTEHDPDNAKADSDEDEARGFHHHRDDLGHIGEPLDCLQDPAACEVYWNDRGVET